MPAFEMLFFEVLDLESRVLENALPAKMPTLEIIYFAGALVQKALPAKISVSKPYIWKESKYILPRQIWLSGFKDLNAQGATLLLVVSCWACAHRALGSFAPITTNT